MFISGVNDTGDIGEIFEKHSFVNILANFRKNLKRPPWNTQGLGGHWFMKKTWSWKSPVKTPFKLIGIHNALPCSGLAELSDINKKTLFEDKIKKFVHFCTFWKISLYNFKSQEIYWLFICKRQECKVLIRSLKGINLNGAHLFATERKNGNLAWNSYRKIVSIQHHL